MAAAGNAVGVADARRDDLDQYSPFPRFVDVYLFDPEWAVLLIDDRGGRTQSNFCLARLSAVYQGRAQAQNG